jgi:hypothetical protein
MAASEGVELERRVPVGDRSGRCARELLGRRAAREPAVAVQHQAVVEAAAEQLVDRQPERLAANIPQRNVDAADQRRNEAVRAQGVEARVQLVPEVLDPRRVLADEQRTESARRGGDQGAVGPARDLAESPNPRVGVDVQKDPRVARPSQVRGRNIGDLHLAIVAAGYARAHTFDECPSLWR